jgi:hypothetical protein
VPGPGVQLTVQVFTNPPPPVRMQLPGIPGGRVPPKVTVPAGLTLYAGSPQIGHEGELGVVKAQIMQAKFKIAAAFRGTAKRGTS